MPLSCVVERKAAGVYPLTAEERQQEEDVQWALHDPEVLANYTGEFVVPVDRRVVAHGEDVESVLGATILARSAGRRRRLADENGRTLLAASIASRRITSRRPS